ncbi:MAG: hypothetical protein PHD06_10120 [Bacteroidales bacterium]|jgi:hypothetical protein|nr:hypothetical protein [Bacteroidales bacterium]MDD4385517.1 hypothetical protein [Bacteroidales bacterium]MDY0197967.1 hypothetical protein [Tenuifilaceae bacterium]
MDSDSIIYIVIAIILAIVNAVAQKKKKARQNSAIKGLVPTREQYHSDEGAVSIEEEDDRPSYDPISLLFGQEGVTASLRADKFQVEDEIEKKAEVQLSDFQKKMSDRAQMHIKERPVSNISIAEFEEDNISSSEIGNVQTLEEEELAISQSQNYFVKDFDAKRAIVYSEIIRPKYFTV